MEYVLILIGGLLGSSHCVGMCGGFALSIGSNSQSAMSNTGRQLVYSLGRIFTYAFLGAVAGFAGASLKNYAGTLINVSAFLSIAAGLLLVWQGLSIIGWVPGTETSTSGAPCLMGSFFRNFLLSSRSSDMLIAGILTGFLPCGLVYAFLALASATGNFLSGALVMTLFGLGTVPLMVLTGLSVSALSIGKRQQLFRAAAVVVILTGVLTVSRGVAFAASRQSSSPVPCPFCHTDTASESS
ncbi:MAG: sulfite exporter TauE/SafE family protein [Planctomycetaceae bacterium]|nr:sulfite exporter TauE/SafE family protein [Planctomycetaceae bacterium]